MTKKLIVTILAIVAAIGIGTGVSVAVGNNDTGPGVANKPAPEVTVAERLASSFLPGELPEAPQPMKNPAPHDIITVGSGEHTVEMTVAEARAAADALAKKYAENGEGITPLWGVRSDGTTGAIAHCEATAPDGLNRNQAEAYNDITSNLPDDLNPEAAVIVLVCTPAPGHEWPESSGLDWDPEIPRG